MTTSPKRTVIRAASPAEMLSAIPYRLGFHPKRSLVAVACRPPRGRMGVTARCDLDDLRHPEMGPVLAAQVARTLVADGADLVVLVRYSAAEDPKPRDDAAIALAIKVMGAAGRRVELWEVDSHVYRPLNARTGGYGGAGRPVSHLETTQTVAAYIAEGAVVAPGRETLVALPTPDSKIAEQAHQAAAARRQEFHEAELARPTTGPKPVTDWRQARYGTWRAVLDAADSACREGRLGRAVAAVTGPVAGEIAALTADPIGRDCVLMSIARPSSPTPALLAGPAGLDGSLGGYGADLLPAKGNLIDPVRLVAVAAVLNHVAAHVPEDFRGGLLAVAAWTAWSAGDGARAALSCDMARAQPDCPPLAGVVDAMVGAGLSPAQRQAA
jgi:hypothetical protein